MGGPCKAASLTERRIQKKTAFSSWLHRETKSSTRGSQALVQTGKSWCCCSREWHLLQQTLLWMGLFQVPPGMAWIYFNCRAYFVAVRRWVALNRLRYCPLYFNFKEVQLGIISCACWYFFWNCCYNLRCNRRLRSIPWARVGYQMVNSLRASLAISSLISNKREWNNCLILWMFRKRSWILAEKFRFPRQIFPAWQHSRAIICM